MHDRKASSARRYPAALAALLIAWSPARSAGGAHVVDDAAVETPGHCHLESWLSGFGDGRGLAVAVPACTPAALPFLEVDGLIDHGWQPGDRTTDLGIGAKAALRSERRGVGLAVTGALAIDAASGRLASAIVNLPVTVPVSGAVRINLNAGAEWLRGRGWAATGGAQAELRPNDRFEFMVETFARTIGRAGAQAGPRWTADKGRIDLDLLVAPLPDGVAARAVTIGMTIRR